MSFFDLISNQYDKNSNSTNSDEILKDSSDSENNSFFNQIPINLIENPIFESIIDKDDYYLVNKQNKENEDKMIEIKENKNSKTTKAPIFIVKKDLFKDSIKFLNKKNRGRNKSLKVNKYDRTHKFDFPDNILRKIHVHFLTFIVSYLNDILKQLNYKQRFLKLKYNFKKKANKTAIKDIKNKTIGEIICNEISNKYKKKGNLFNKEIYGQIKDKEILNKIFSESYLNLFKKIYHKSIKRINLKEYGYDKEIILSNDVKMYKDLLLKDIKKDLNKGYQKKYDECIRVNFI